MPNPATVYCRQCGTKATGTGKFCKKCGNALGAGSVAPVADEPRPTAPTASPVAGVKRGLSIWWVIVPTLLFFYLSRRMVPMVIVTVIGAGLWIARTKKIPSTADRNLKALEPFLPFAPAMQAFIVFVMLGGNPIVTAALLAGVFFAVKHRHKLIAALEPWWQIQTSIPSGIRKPLAIAAAALVGYYFGNRAGGQEWTYTLISISFGIVVAFLIIFTPPDSARPAKKT
jgi:hypothetical protein